ncbi:MAG: TIGR04283 family arsenosugar biosynthesis glycosyltransferase [Ginsengibacter sp.]|jgi:rSAM/selenodomain-associated transferase 2
MISIIIPTFNEEDNIAETIKNLRNRDNKNRIVEIIVADGHSTDNTVLVASNSGAQAVVCDKKGRAAQMNYGASIAKGTILYFLHADSIPPNGFTQNILNAVQNKYTSGCFRLAFDYNHWFLKANCWFTRFDINAVRFGDQSLFVTKNIFEKCGGFDENLFMMEDQEIVHRIKRYGKFIVMKDAVITSARKYLNNGIYRMQLIFFRIWLLYYLGYSQQYLLKLHKKMIRKSKL